MDQKNNLVTTQDENQDFKVITKRADGSKKVVTKNTLPTRTQQHHKDLTDPNALIRKYGHKHLRMPDPSFYRDFSQIPDLITAQNTLVQAEASWQKIPSHIRNRFDNDAHKLIDFLNSTDQNDIDESIKLGLRNPKPEPVEDPQLTAMKEIAANTRKPKKQNSDD